jgi:hypothetical protein
MTCACKSGKVPKILSSILLARLRYIIIIKLCNNFFFCMEVCMDCPMKLCIKSQITVTRSIMSLNFVVTISIRSPTSEWHDWSSYSEVGWHDQSYHSKVKWRDQSFHSTSAWQDQSCHPTLEFFISNTNNHLVELMFTAICD